MGQQDRNQVGLDSAQRQAVMSADRTTGEVPGTDRVRSSLVALGLAVHHGRRGAVYLTPAGHALRNAVEAPAPSVSVTDGPDGQGFRPATGDDPTFPLEPVDRPQEVARAWAGVMEIRRLNGDTTVPAPWELARMEWSVALALEAAGLPLARGRPGPAGAGRLQGHPLTRT
ncbi:hypothetical protein ACFXG8_08130 [Kitasatospora indigofera]|uniref:hypothetical protein n=1 Tax=Kitasatospora indigofera TaxID=67307 RepID=UPI0036A18752